MSEPFARAVERLEALDARSPGAIKLARAASLAVRLDTRLLRMLRRELLPEVDVGAEADLWFSPLIESRGSSSVVLLPQVVSVLRASLAMEPAALLRAAAVTAAAHATLSPTLRLEEQVTGLALAGGANAVEEIDRAFQPVLRALRTNDTQALSLARWMLRAAPRLPPLVWEAPNAYAMVLAASILLGGRAPLASTPRQTRAGVQELAWTLPRNVLESRAPVGVELSDTTLTFLPAADAAATIDIPPIAAPVVEVAWTTASGQGTHLLVDAVPGRSTDVGTGVDQLTIRTLAGDVYRVAREVIETATATPAAPPWRPERAKVLDSVPRDRACVRVIGGDGIEATGFLVSPKVVATARLLALNGSDLRVQIGTTLHDARVVSEGDDPVLLLELREPVTGIEPLPLVTRVTRSERRPDANALIVPSTGRVVAALATGTVVIEAKITLTSDRATVFDVELPERRVPPGFLGAPVILPGGAAGIITEVSGGGALPFLMMRATGSVVIERALQRTAPTSEVASESAARRSTQSEETPRSSVQSEAAPTSSVQSETAPPHDATGIPRVAMRHPWERFFESPARREVEERALLPFLQRQRWFGRKEAPNLQARFVDWIPLLPSAPLFAAIVAVRSSGEPTFHLVFLAVVEPRVAERTDPGNAIVARLTGGREALLVDAVLDERLPLALASLFDGRNRTGQFGRLGSIVTPALTALGGARGFEPIRPSDAQRVTYAGERLLLQLLPQTWPGSEPAFEIGQFLATRGEFTGTPRVAGALEYRGEREPLIVALLTERMYGYEDGWAYTLKQIERLLEWAESRTGSLPGARPGPVTIGAILRDAAESPGDVAGELIGMAEAMGRQLGELHATLVSDRTFPPLSPEPMTIADWTSHVAGVRNKGKRVLPRVARSAAVLPPGVRPDELEKRLDGHLDTIPPEGTPGAKMRVHGDLHLGQLLLSAAVQRVVITDYEAGATRPPAERAHKRSPLVDVAAMMRSFSYAAGAGVLSRTADEEHRAALEPFALLCARWGHGAFLRGYLPVAEKAGLLPPQEYERDALLQLFLLERALFELEYEVQNRPDWVRVPLSGLLEVLQSPPPRGPVVV